MGYRPRCDTYRRRDSLRTQQEDLKLDAAPNAAEGAGYLPDLRLFCDWFPHDSQLTGFHHVKHSLPAQGGTRRRDRKRRHQRHIAGKSRNSKRRRHAAAKNRERARRYVQQRDQEMRRQIRDILLEAQPKMVAIESLK